MVFRSEEANKAFSAGVQLHDTLVKAWALWGDFLEQIFTKVTNPPIPAMLYGWPTGDWS